jgi:IclR family transcriptional regulator, KDG regulon repressor
MAASPNGSDLVPAVDRAAQILKTLAASDVSLGVSEIGRQLGLNKSTVHDIVATLSRHRLVERDGTTKTYRLGHALAELGQRAGARANLQTAAHPRLVAFARSVEETVLLGTYYDGHVTIVDREEAPHALKITSPIGHRLYYSVGAFGKIFLAAMTDPQVTELLSDKPPRAFTPRSITKPAAYRAALERVRSLGYALDDEEYMSGVRAAAAPLVDARGFVIAALCVVGFESRLRHDKLIRIAKQTRETAEKISRDLGAVEYPAWKGVG